MQRKEYFLILHDIKTKLWVAQATAHQAGQLTPAELTAWNALRDATNEAHRIMLEENDRRAGRTCVRQEATSGIPNPQHTNTKKPK